MYDVHVRWRIHGFDIALPTIQTDLNMREAALQWIASALTHTSGYFLLLAGRMADVHGRKLVFMCGLGWYAVWCLIGGFLKNGAGLVIRVHWRARARRWGEYISITNAPSC
jgi:MFS family permease